jgi:hypothetical protein
VEAPRFARAMGGEGSPGAAETHQRSITPRRSGRFASHRNGGGSIARGWKLVASRARRSKASAGSGRRSLSTAAVCAGICRGGRRPGTELPQTSGRWSGGAVHLARTPLAEGASFDEPVARTADGNVVSAADVRLAEVGGVGLLSSVAAPAVTPVYPISASCQGHELLFPAGQCRRLGADLEELGGEQVHVYQAAGG